MPLVLHAAFVALMAYALHGTGVCCDDFPQIVFRTAVPPVEEWYATPLLIATHGLAYAWLGYGSFWLYELLKFGWVALAYAMAYRFGALWFSAPRAAFFAALFLLYPAHDSTNFWFSNQYLTLTSAFYLYAFAFAERGRLAGAAAMSALGSFMSYGSPPWSFGLALAFALRKKYRETAALVVPQLVYVAYYLVLTEQLGIGSKRLPSQWDAASLAKQLLLQIAGGLDAVAGPSLALKIWWSVASLTVVSALVGAALWYVALRVRIEPVAARIPGAVWVAVLAVAFGGFGIFALTGQYPQSAFGLGNRVTIYASFAAAFAICALPWPRSAHTVIAGLLIFATLGVSDHWRSWRVVQEETIEAIRAHPELASGGVGAETLFVVGRDYSRLGPLGHIALFTEPWMTDAVFALALAEEKTFRTAPLTSRHLLTPEGLLDTKHGTRYPLAGTVAVWFAESGELRRLDRGELAALLGELRPPPRHWIQLVDLPWLRALILRWMPQLGYLFSQGP